MIIKLSAFGDIVLAIPAFQAIREFHPNAETILLTKPDFLELAGQIGCFDRIIPHRRFPYHDWRSALELRRLIKSLNPERIYDLQCVDRTFFYFLLFFPAPPWCGTAPGARFRDRNKDRKTLHVIDRDARQLQIAGVPLRDSPPDMAWLEPIAEPSDALPEKFALIIPGASAHRRVKCWPAENYARICCILLARGIVPLLIGTKTEDEIIPRIKGSVPQTIDLTGQTSHAQIGKLALRAACVIGNDTGPTQMAWLAGARTVMLMGEETLAGLAFPPKWARVKIIRKAKIEEISVEELESILEIE